MLARALMVVLAVSVSLPAADESVETTIKDLYAASQKAMREARTKEEMARALATFAPEWVGNMPAGETLTLADLMKEAEAGVAVPPEKRPIPKQDFVYIRQTGWNVLVVYWSSRRSGNRLIGSLYRDTWVRTADGWRRIRQEKFFPDRPLIQDGKPVILPPVE
ncbi:MAG TPA: hypothetical protein VMB03_30570 [Bryobacteraceae bacterium]|nr:hypothetical protein [Bryobacteraceae bacterium]